MKIKINWELPSNREEYRVAIQIKDDPNISIKQIIILQIFALIIIR